MSARRCAVLLFVFLDFLFLLTSSGRIRTMDELMTMYQTESLVLRGSTAVPQAAATGNWFGKYDRFGNPRPAPPPGHSIAAMPWYALGQFVLAKLPGVPTDARDLIIGWALAMSSATFAAAAAALAFLLFNALGLELSTALFATAVITFGTPLFAYSAWFYSEPLSAALLLGAALALFGTRETALGRAMLCGALLGVAVLVRPTQILAAPAFMLGLLMRDGKRALQPLVVLAAALSLFVIAYLSYNDVLFGSPLEFGYPAFADNGKPVLVFTNPARGLWAFLFSPGKSVFIFAPPILLALYGLRQLWKRDRGLATVAALVPLVYLLFYSCYASFEGGYSWGPRYMVPALMLLCLAIAPAVQQAKRAAWLLLAIGFAVQAIGMATSFLEGAVSGGYYNKFWDYELWYSPLTVQGKLFFKYLLSGEPAKIGTGWDRWFVFLYKGGVSVATLLVIGAVMTAGAVGSGLLLRRSFRRRPDPPARRLRQP